MNSSSNASHLPPPPVMWAQGKDKIFLTIQLENCKNPTITLKDDSLHFRGKGGPGNTEHEVLIEFNKEIDSDTSKFQVTEREVFFVLTKKESSRGFWPRLLKDCKKVHYLKTDFNRWKDEDDSDAENNEDFNLDEMMSSMGGLQGAGGVPDLDDQEEDSDDEDLPDLQE
ncbi:unnamed protein product [Candidula unifasciata]|uniref:CS domain-containing protein n=1 Tax=Candidula unifasciata TaxID=100452 RepID=A0A8S3YVB8_9EUPU|nr:unnamed protein product [Candidula unifasciata]